MNTSMEEWVEALRSGKFRQGQNVLYEPKTDTYCCLGVLCRLDNWDISPCGNGAGDDCPDYNSELYASLREELGHSFVSEVIKMNDEGRSFAEIADYIETERKSIK